MPRELGPSITLEGPDIELAPNDALSLGLGDPRTGDQCRQIRRAQPAVGPARDPWSLEPCGSKARVDWAERGGPPVPAERGRGFGTDLIEKIVAHELQHPVELRFDPEGVSCTLVVPVRASQQFELRAPPLTAPMLGYSDAPVSKNSAWLIAARTLASRNGLVTR